jgi:hypothetical protein
VGAFDSFATMVFSPRCVVPLIIFGLLAAPAQAWADEGNAVAYPPSTELPAGHTGPATGASKGPHVPGHLPLPQEKAPLPDEQVWEDVKMITKGSFKVCEVAVLPLALISGVGEVLDWLCLVPAIMTLNHYGVKHARRATYYWEPLVALAVAKLVRDALFYAYVIAAVASVVLYVTGAGIFLVFTGSTFMWPVGLAGLLAVIGGTYLVYSDMKDAIFYWLTGGIYMLMSPKIKKGEDSWADVVEIVDPPATGILRPWALLVAGAGGRARGSMSHAIPLYGPYKKGESRAERLKEEMDRLGREVLDDVPDDPDALNNSIDFWTASEATVTAGSQLFLLAGGGLALAGLGFAVHANYQLEQGEDAAQSGWLAAGLGTMGIVSAGTGIGLALVRKVPSALLAIMAGWHFGYSGPDEDGGEGEGEDAGEAENASRAAPGAKKAP